MQTQPDDYLYSGAFTFTLNAFTLDPPSCGPITTYTCSVISGKRTDLCSISDGSTSGVFTRSTGKYEFSSTDMLNFEPGNYAFEISATIGSKSASRTFSMTLVDPCPEAVLTLLPSPFEDTVAWRREASIQEWTISDLVISSTSIDCGPISVDFFNNNALKSELDSSVFFDDRSGSLTNTFTVLQADEVTQNMEFPICYRLHYINYPQIEVE